MKTLQEIEKELIVERLAEFKGNKTKAAGSLGITIKTLYNKLHQYDLFNQFQSGKKELDLTIAGVLNTQE